MTDTIYTAPRSDLAQPRVGAGEYGSLERGIAGDYPFSIRAILKEAWQRTEGAKLTLVLAALLYFAIYMAVSIGLSMVAGLAGGAPDPEAAVQPGQIAISLVVNLVVTAFGTALGMGLFLMGLRRAVDAPITVTMVFEGLPLIVPIFLAMLLMYLLVAVGFLLLVIPGIYLVVAYYLALPLVVEKKLGAWQALEASRKALGKHWFRTFGLALALGLVNVLGVLALGIGLVWTVPMSMIAFGILYRNVFGVEPATAAG